MLNALKDLADALYAPEDTRPTVVLDSDYSEPRTLSGAFPKATALDEAALEQLVVTTVWALRTGQERVSVEFERETETVVRMLLVCEPPLLPRVSAALALVVQAAAVAQGQNVVMEANQ